MIRNLPIRSKLVTVLALPVLALLALGTLRVAKDVGDDFEARRVSRVTAFAGKLSALVHELQKERDQSAGYAAARKRSGYGRVVAQRVWADQALTAFRAELAKLGLDEPGSRLGDRLTRATQGLDGLDRQREVLDGDGPLDADATLRGYGDVIHDLLEVTAAMPAESADQELARQIQALVALERAKEAGASKRSLMYAALLAGRFEAGWYQRFAALGGAEQTWLAEFRTAADDRQRGYLTSIVAGRDVQRADSLERAVLTQDPGAPPAVDAREWLTTTSAKVDLLRAVELRLADDVVRDAAAAKRQAERQAFVGSALVVLVLLVSIGLSVAIARSMARSLRLLRRAAHKVARRTLPETVDRLQRITHGDDPTLPLVQERPLEVRSRDEVGDVAEAFNAVHDVAVRVATEQAALRVSLADLFRNLAQRNQKLIDRQLELLDELERDELDPRKLEELFRLDHLATRMRRHAEDLVVLSGARPSRQWSEGPIALVDAVRAALAEVEEFTRVDLLPIENLAVPGEVAGDLVHLIAELIENAVSFSPPGAPVSIGGQPTAGGYVLEIEDRGIGMSDSELAVANKKLSNPPRFDLSLSERLGLFVVGRLASRHEIRVKLRHSWYDGVTSLVVIPDRLLEGTAPAAAPQPALARRRVPASPEGGGRAGELPVPEGLPEEPPRPPAEALPIFEAARSRFLDPDPDAAPPVPAPVEVDEPEPVAAVVTQAGLPQRVPQANLAPGIADGLGDAWKSAPLASNRSPTQIRERLDRLRAAWQQARRDASAHDDDGTLIGSDLMWSRSNNDPAQ
ncbi:MAG TPA: nitrate- and nitrite sensing domain-containing protein [Actinomycetes bacterium]|nr:nitrate- and nitrite sensing domain-containing protein [Actinomycetes bacterium]